VVPIGGGDVQTMIRMKKLENDEFETEEFGAFRFVPMLQNKAND